jgi:hypothetical protein
MTSLSQNKFTKYQIIVVTYNHDHCVGDLLNSILYQINFYGQNKSIEILFIDDSSSDKTVKIINQYRLMFDQLYIKSSLIINDLNKGIKENSIYAYNKIDSPKFIIVAGDDLFFCNNIFSFMDFSSRHGMVCSNCIKYYNDKYWLESESRINSLFSKRKLLLFFLKFINPITAPGIWYSRELLTDEKLHEFMRVSDYRAEDWLIHKYIIPKINTDEIIFYHEPVILYRPHYGRKTIPIYSNNIVKSFFELLSSFKFKEIIKILIIRLFSFVQFLLIGEKIEDTLLEDIGYFSEVIHLKNK